MVKNVRCLVCGISKKVNGQKNIDLFRRDHIHGDKIALLTGKNIVIEEDHADHNCWASR